MDGICHSETSLRVILISIGAPQVQTETKQIMRRFEGHNKDRRSEPEQYYGSDAVKVRYILLNLSTPSRHFHAVGKSRCCIVLATVSE